MEKYCNNCLENFWEISVRGCFDEARKDFLQMSLVGKVQNHKKIFEAVRMPEFMKIARLEVLLTMCKQEARKVAEQKRVLTHLKNRFRILLYIIRMSVRICMKARVIRVLEIGHCGQLKPHLIRKIQICKLKMSI